HQVDAQVADVGVVDAHRHFQVGRGVAADATDRDRAFHARTIDDLHVAAVLEVGVATTAAVTVEAAGKADARERAVATQHHVVRACLHVADAAGLVVAT